MRCSRSDHLIVIVERRSVEWRATVATGESEAVYRHYRTSTFGAGGRECQLPACGIGDTDNGTGFAGSGISLPYVWGFRIEPFRVHYSQNRKINATWQEQFKRVTAKPPKPIDTFLSFVSQLSPGTLRRLKTPM
jgi:hypothetical protein